MLISVPRPTQRELAQRLGLTQAAVSLALRGSERVSPATRARVSDLARNLGYRLDPALAALSQRRWTDTATTLAYIGDRSPPPGPDYVQQHVARACAQRGIELWPVPVPALADDAKVQRALDRHPTAGVVLSHTWHPAGPRRLAWSRLRSVHCGLLMAPDSGDVVCPDTPSAVLTCWRRMKAKGYRSIGAMMFIDDSRIHAVQLLAGAMLALEATVNDRRIFEVWIGTHRRLGDAAKWVRSRSPEAVLGYYSGVLYHLRDRGIDVPYAAVAGDPGSPTIAGTQVDFDAIADAAVDHLVRRLPEPPGPPPERRMHLLEMRWRDGASLPQKT
jgi:DNA-binding LacI/PurR family transcriptional regulator